MSGRGTNNVSDAVVTLAIGGATARRAPDDGPPSAKPYLRIQTVAAAGVNVQRFTEKGGAEGELLKCIREADVDGDGWLSVEELLAAFQSAVKDKRAAILWRRLLLLVTVVSILLTGAVVGLTAVVIVQTKDTEVSGGNALVSRDSGQPVQVANADFYVAPSGLLISRNVQGRSGSAVLVKASQRTPFDVDMPLDQLAQMTQFVASGGGVTVIGQAEIVLHVHAAVRLNSPALLPAASAPHHSSPAANATANASSNASSNDSAPAPPAPPTSILLHTALGLLELKGSCEAMGEDFVDALEALGVRTGLPPPDPATGRRLLQWGFTCYVCFL
ncbi:hypothetical protein HYH03_006004 [Edaphochlamys debaryana]|uniref:EF-hand domain-containing protein n=1 Tax=Edaphochlamys debaryana TaxID=47281 RepID=A0A835YBB6_9CHLO|nr:hypothetical protein HYH03_006004 [Edaphochlamys debaryana]|eukprot:KAG2495755.1 hypothetical protein HYH03_006004 [Edaphochlamys debaryana]